MNARRDPLSFFLSAEEVEHLTGFKLPRHQARWLSAKGWRFELNANRKPIIARGYVERMLGCSEVEQRQARPNFMALRNI